MNNPRETPVIPLVPRVPEIFSLPNELLVAIAAAGQENRLPLWLDRDGAFKSESTLSHVCRHLRAAIIGAPELWTLVEADLDLDGSVENFKLYLERSRASKIWVTVREFGLEPDILSEHIALLLPHTHRIWRLGIMSTVNSINAMLDPFRDVAAPCLEHLEIYRDELLPGPFPLEMFASGQPAHLSILKLDGFTPRFPIPKWATSITHLKLRRGQEVDGLDGKRLFVAMVQQCRSLVHLYLDTNVLHRPEVIGRISIPSLKSLHLLLWNHGSNHLLVRVFRVLDTPALTDITIDCAHGHDISELFNPMTTGVDEKATQWRYIRPRPGSFPLSSLTLIEQCFTAHILEGLLGPASEPWPLLVTLTLRPATSALEAVFSALQRVVQSKRQREETVPKFRLSPALFYEDYWETYGVEVELFDPAELRAACID